MYFILKNILVLPDRGYIWIGCDLKSCFPLIPHNIPELQHTGLIQIMAF